MEGRNICVDLTIDVFGQRWTDHVTAENNVISVRVELSGTHK
jgi:hypothetical protein